MEDDFQFCQEIASFIHKKMDGMRVEYFAHRGEEFLKVIAQNKPDICMIDIGLPDVSGVDIARRIREQYFDSDIIFITAYDNYFSEAVNVYAVDYITKPPDYNRLQQTLQRIKYTKSVVENTVEIKTEDKEILLLKEKEILFMESYGRKTIIYTVDGIQHVALQSLNKFQQKLSSSIFFRSSRFHILNLTQIHSIEPFTRTSFKVHFNNTEITANLSKKQYPCFREEIKELFKNR